MNLYTVLIDDGWPARVTSAHLSKDSAIAAAQALVAAAALVNKIEPYEPNADDAADWLPNVVWSQALESAEKTLHGDTIFYSAVVQEHVVAP